MSQGEFDKSSPWAWSDKTIVSLMEELDKVKALVDKYPNNMELGKHIRSWYHKLKGDD